MAGTRLRFKACPKCRGDLQLVDDLYGRYWECLQCGFIRDLEGAPAGPDRMAA